MSRRMSITLGIVGVLVLIFAGFAYAQTPAATEEATAPEVTVAPETATEIVTETAAVTPTATSPATSPATTGCPYGNYMDNDGDGVCDYREDGGMAQQWGPRAGMGRMGGMMQSGGMMRGGMMHWGHNYVDADGDGVCDNCDNDDDSSGGSSGESQYGNRPHMGGQGMMGRGWNR